jgi:hypothetical protein
MECDKMVAADMDKSRLLLKNLVHSITSNLCKEAILVYARSI